jgi:glycerol dehydrogenase-like iron-containing ADH family enzyme
MRKLEKQEPVAFHGAKVGVATLLIIRLYKNIVENRYGIPVFQKPEIDWEPIYNVFDKSMWDDLNEVNNPSVLELTSPSIMKEKWPEISQIINEELPSYDELLQLMNAAHAVISIDEIDVDEQLALDALRYHPFLRYRINLTTLIPMLGLQPDYEELLKT